MKRIVICCDGTSNKPDIDNVTNVVKVASGIANVDGDNNPQVVFYDQGVGSDGLIDHLTGGIFGWGVTKNIREAYRFLVTNYSPGDEIYIFGFSRGAFTARSLSGLISKFGILNRSEIHNIRNVIDHYRESKDDPRDKDSGEKIATDKDARIKFLGIWDTVGAMGIQLIRFVGTLGWWPGQLIRIPIAALLLLNWKESSKWKRTEVIPEFTRAAARAGAHVVVEVLNWMRFWTKTRHKFHDTRLAVNVDYAYHAVAIDERRPIFEAVLWESKTSETKEMKQVWFSGVHTEVGGGSPNVATSIRPLRWMTARAHERGLRFTEEFYKVIEQGYCLPRTSISPSPSGIYLPLGWLRRKIAVNGSQNEFIHESAVHRYQASKAGPLRNTIHDSLLRLVGLIPKFRKKNLAYAPDNLVDVMEPTNKLPEEPEEPGEPGIPPVAKPAP